MRPAKGQTRRVRRLTCALAVTILVAMCTVCIMTQVSLKTTHVDALTVISPANTSLDMRANSTTAPLDKCAWCHPRFDGACPCAETSYRMEVHDAWRNTSSVTHSPIAVTLSSKLINDLANVFVPFVNDQMSNMTLPAQHLEYGVISEMHLKDFYTESVDIQLAVKKGEDVAITVSNISVVVPPTPFTIKVTGVTCKGQMWSSMNKTTIQFVMHVYTLANGTLRADVNHTTATWGSMLFNHNIDSAFCRVAQSVVEVFVGKIDNIAIKAIKSKMIELLPQIISDNVSTQLARIPFPFVSDPVFAPERVTTTVSSSLSRAEAVREDDVRDLAAIAATAGVRRRHGDMLYKLRWPMREGALVPPRRDVGLSIPAASVNDFLSYEHMMGNLYLDFELPRAYDSSILKNVFPNAYEICPDCPLGLVLMPQCTPLVVYEQATRSVMVELTHLFLGIMMVPRNSTLAGATRYTLSERSNKSAGVVNDKQANTRGACDCRKERCSVCRPDDSGDDGGDESAPGLGDCALREETLCAILSRWRKEAVNKGQPRQSGSPLTRNNKARLSEDFTLLMLSVNATAMVSNLSITGDDANVVNFFIQRLTNFSVGVVKSNVGPLIDSDLTSNAELMMNYVAIPLLNLFSPFTLPYTFSDAIIAITDTLMNVGVNVHMPFHDKRYTTHSSS